MLILNSGKLAVAIELENSNGLGRDTAVLKIGHEKYKNTLYGTSV